jgi:hypothetical protein
MTNGKEKWAFGKKKKNNRRGGGDQYSEKTCSCPICPPQIPYELTTINTSHLSYNIIYLRI